MAFDPRNDGGGVAQAVAAAIPQAEEDADLQQSVMMTEMATFRAFTAGSLASTSRIRQRSRCRNRRKGLRGDRGWPESGAGRGRKFPHRATSENPE
jgi:hypothetical protein